MLPGRGINMSFVRAYRLPIALVAVFAYLNLIVPELLSAQELSPAEAAEVEGSATAVHEEAARVEASAEQKAAPSESDASHATTPAQAEPGDPLNEAKEMMSRSSSSIAAASVGGGAGSGGANPLG